MKHKMASLFAKRNVPLSAIQKLVGH